MRKTAQLFEVGSSKNLKPIDLLEISTVKTKYILAWALCSIRKNNLMISTQNLSQLLATLYSAPLEEANWQIFLDGLCKEIGAVIGLFSATDVKLGANKILAQGGINYNSEMQRLYNAYYGRIDPYRIAFERNPRIGAIVGEELVTADSVKKTEFFNDLAVPTGVGHAMVLPAVFTQNGVEAISVWRGIKRGPFNSESTTLLEMLLPHVQTALKTRRTLETANARASQLDAALDASPIANLILDASGRVLSCNRAAENIIRLHDGISVVKGRIIAEEPAAQRKLQALIALAVEAAGAKHCLPGGAQAIPRRSGKRPFQVGILPLRLPTETSPIHVLIQVTDPEAAVRLPASRLASLYGLTRAEAEVANALLTGLTVNEIAERRGVTAETLRSQVKSILQKTDTRRQSELIRLLTAVPSSVV